MPRVLAVSLFICLVSAACGGGSSPSTIPYDGPMTVPYNGPAISPPPPAPATGPQAELDRERALWDRQEIVNYRFTLQRTIFGPPPFTDPVVVQVRGGQVASQVYELTGLPVNPKDASWWPPIIGLFEILQDALDRNADQIDVTYDPGLGYPTWPASTTASAWATTSTPSRCGTLPSCPERAVRRCSSSGRDAMGST